MISQNSYNSSKVSEYRINQNQQEDNFQQRMLKLNKNHQKYQQFKKSFNFNDLAKSNKSNKSDENQELFQLKKQSKIRYFQSPIVNRYTSKDNVFYIKNQNQPAIINRKSSKQYSSQSKSNFYSPTNSKSPYKIFQKQNDENSQRKSIQQKINQCAANELIWQTEKEMMQKIIQRQKSQIKDYEKKAEQYWKQRQNLMRLKSRNEILQRQYQILKQQHQRLKGEKTINNVYSFEVTNPHNKYDKSLKNWQQNNINKNPMNSINLLSSSYKNNQTKDLLKRTDSFTSNNFTQNIDIKQIEINRLKQQINQVKLNLNQKIEDNSIINAKMNSLQTQLKKSQLQSNQIRNKLNNEQQIIKKLELQKEKYISNYKVIKKQRQREKAKDQEKLKQIQALQSQLQNKQLKLQSNRQELETYKNKEKKLKVQLQEKQQQIQTLRRDYLKLKLNLNELQLEPQMLKKKFIEQIKQINLELDQIKKKNNALKMENSQLEEQILKIKKENKKFAIKLCDTQTLLQKLQIQHLNVTQKFKQAHIKTVNFETSKQQSQNKLSYLNNEHLKKLSQTNQNWVHKFNQQRKLFDQQKVQFQLVLQGKQNEIMKLRKQIEELLKELIKYRASAQRYKKFQILMKYQMNINQTVEHLWSVKQVQYLKVNKILQIIKINKQQEELSLKADQQKINSDKLQVVNQVTQSIDELRNNEIYLKQKQKAYQLEQKQKSFNNQT